MTVLHTGSNKKYAEGWETLFGKQGTRGKTSAKKSAGRAAKKSGGTAAMKSTKKTAGKPAAKKKARRKA